MADETQTADTTAALNFKAAPKEAPKAPPAPTPVTGGGAGGVQLVDANGNDLGVTVDTAPGAGQDASVADIASRIKGWSTLVVDGQPFEYSEANALALLLRFPHFADQLR